MNKNEIIEYFSLFSNHESDGLEYLFSDKGKEEVFERLKNIDSQHLSKVQLNQLLIRPLQLSIAARIYYTKGISLLEN